MIAMRRTLILVIAVILVLFLSPLIGFASVVQPVKAQQTTTTFSDNFSTSTGAWQYLGSAYRDAENQCMVLTTGDLMKGELPFSKHLFKALFLQVFAIR